MNYNRIIMSLLVFLLVCILSLMCLYATSRAYSKCVDRIQEIKEMYPDEEEVYYEAIEQSRQSD